jgi:hypothetical protein
MKITKRQLRRIIREEKERLINEQCGLPEDDIDQGRDLGYGEGEGRMAKSQLFKIGQYAQSLHDTLVDEDDLPEWVLSKIAVISSDIGKIKHYLEYKIMRMEKNHHSD